jgi:hypothetical protein
MPSNPQWVKDLKPASPQGSELLKKERDGSNINVQAISEFLHTKKELDRKYRVLKVLENEKVFDKSQNYFAGRIDRFETSLARAKRLRQLTVKLGWDKDDFNTANELLSESTPYRLHDSMFLVCLRDSLGTMGAKSKHRSHSATKELQNSTKSSSRKPRTLRLSAATPKPNSATALTCEVLKRRPPGTHPTRPSPSILPHSQPRNGGSAH